MHVLVGCECSGVVRQAFRDRGHDAWSCDLKPAEDGSKYHIVGDVRDAIAKGGWDLGIFHPVCRYLANSGVQHLYIGRKKGNGLNEQRWALMREGAQFFRECLAAPIERVAVENPIPHPYALELMGRGPDQVIQPWMHGHKESKATCLWLKNLNPILPTKIVYPMPGEAVDRKAWERVWNLPPGPNREADRSRTLPGLAAAYADQWGSNAPVWQMGSLFDA
jgi:hypothetical protein